MTIYDFVTTNRSFELDPQTALTFSLLHLAGCSERNAENQWQSYYRHHYVVVDETRLDKGSSQRSDKCVKCKGSAQAHGSVSMADYVNSKYCTLR